MAFDFGSDILVGAMRAADPEQVRAAKLRLTEATQARSNADVPVATFAADRAKIQRPASPGDKTQAEAYRKFEAAVLTTFVQAMMPKQSSAVFGEGLAGDMWKAQMAEQIAGQLAQRGGIGIASRLLKEHLVTDDGVEAISGLSDPANAVRDSRAIDDARSFLNSLQRHVLGQGEMEQGGNALVPRSSFGV